LYCHPIETTPQAQLSEVMGFPIHFSMSVAAAVRLWGLNSDAIQEAACWIGAQVGLGVSEIMVGFVASLAGMWGNHDDRALRLDRSWLHLKVEYRRPRAEGEDSIPPRKRL
jgi:hypothetical protein